MTYDEILKRLEEQEQIEFCSGLQRYVYKKTRRGKIICLVHYNITNNRMGVCYVTRAEGFFSSQHFSYCPNQKREKDRYFANYIMEQWL